jgi:hypothetical protein
MLAQPKQEERGKTKTVCGSRGCVGPWQQERKALHHGFPLVPALHAPPLPNLAFSSRAGADGAQLVPSLLPDS